MIVVVLSIIVTAVAVLARDEQWTAASATEDIILPQQANMIKIMESANRSIKYCADLSSLRHFVETSIEPYYRPLIKLLPDQVQVALLEETSFGGFTYASCLLAAFLAVAGMLAWFTAARYMQAETLNANAKLNECVLSLKLALNEANLRASTFEHEIGKLQAYVKESESKVSKCIERLEMYKSAAEASSREADKLRESESRALKELNSARLELAEAREASERQRVDHEHLSAQLTSVREQLKSNETQLAAANVALAEQKLQQQQQQQEISQYEMISRVVTTDDPVVAARISDLEEHVSHLEKQLSAKQEECLTLNNAVKVSGEKLNDFERQLKENEIQIKLLNELREKDAKQHVKSLSDMDNQLKKKKTEAEKNALLLEQLRAKSERIHELEAQFSRIEKQSTSERQTYEKQAHETWLQSRKAERELKDAKAELAALKERLNDCETSLKAALSDNVTLKFKLQQQQVAAAAGYFMQPKVYSPDEAGQRAQNESPTPLTDQLKIDTTSIQPNHMPNDDVTGNKPPSSASSTTSGSGGGGSASKHPHHHIHQPSPKYVSPASTATAAAVAAAAMMMQPSPPLLPPSNSLNGMLMPPLPPSQHHIMMMKMMMQQQYYQKYMAAAAAAAAAATGAKNSPVASNQPSPHHHNISHSATYPNGNSTSFLNDSSSMGNMSSPRGSSLEKDDEQPVLTSTSSKPPHMSGSGEKMANSIIDSTNTSMVGDVAPTNLASNFEV